MLYLFKEVANQHSTPNPKIHSGKGQLSYKTQILRAGKATIKATLTPPLNLLLK